MKIKYKDNEIDLSQNSFIYGENGSGKTLLAKKISERGYSINYLNHENFQSNIELQELTDIQKKFIKKQFEFNFNQDVEKVEYLSSGQKKYINLLKSVLINKSKLLFLDDFEFHLSLNIQSKIVSEILKAKELNSNNFNIFIVSHSPFIYHGCKELDFNLIPLQ